MGREILFKAQRTDTKEWVFGYVARVHHRNEKGEIESYFFNALDELGWSYECVVSAETVCQYTGLTDNTQWEELSEEEKEKFLLEWNHVKDRKNTKEDWNGRKIFEWDIVKAEFSFNDFARDRVEHKEHIYEISYHEKYCYFFLKRKNNNLLLDGNWSYALMEIEVIGNIFDNPELLNQ